MKTIMLIFAGLCLLGQIAAAQQPAGGLSDYLPGDNEVAGLQLDGPPNTYTGDELFQMINGGADIYHEYGFRQVLEASYTDGNRLRVRLEIYKMASPASAYGMYTFKTSGQGQELSIGQEALLQDYYLNFWKGNMLVTMIGMDSEEETVKSVIDLARAVDRRITRAGERPELVDLLLSQPAAISQAKYVRGPLGVMSSYIFDTKNIFQVREGVIGTLGECRAFVFQYPDSGQSMAVYKSAANILKSSTRFSNQDIKEHTCSMVDRKNDCVLINQAGRFIIVVMGQDQSEVKSVSDRLTEKLDTGGDS